MKGPRVRQNIFDAPVAPRVHEAIDLTPFLVAPEEVRDPPSTRAPGSGITRARLARRSRTRRPR
jgi:hypothetical protein